MSIFHIHKWVAPDSEGPFDDGDCIVRGELPEIFFQGAWWDMAAFLKGRLSSVEEPCEPPEAQTQSVDGVKLQLGDRKLYVDPDADPEQRNGIYEVRVHPPERTEPPPGIEVFSLDEIDPTPEAIAFRRETGIPQWSWGHSPSSGTMFEKRQDAVDAAWAAVDALSATDYATNPVHGIVRSTGPCRRCGIRAWRWHRPASEGLLGLEVEVPARLVCVGCDQGKDGEFYPCKVLFRPPGTDPEISLDVLGRIQEQTRDLEVENATMRAERDAKPDADVVELHPEVTCHRCKKRVLPGTPYAQVRLPGGEEVPVHPECMGGEAL